MAMQSSPDYWAGLSSGMAIQLLPWKTDRAKALQMDGSYLIPCPSRQGLEEFATTHNVSSGIIVKAAWAIVLSRYSGSDDAYFVVHCVTAGSSSCGLSRLLLQTGMSFLDVVRATQRQSEEQQPELLSDFQTLRSILPSTVRECCNVSFHELYGAELVPPFSIDDATLSLCFGGADFLKLTFDSECLSPIQVKSIASNVGTLLDSIISSGSNSNIDDLEMTSDFDKTMMGTFNNQDVEVVYDVVHALVERQVTLTPFAEAVCSWDGSFTYQEVSNLSSKLAFHLRAINVTPGTIVPILSEKTKWYPIANLAVLKAGCACAAIDPDHPDARIQSILHCTQATVVLTTVKLANRIKGNTDIRFVAIGEDFFAEKSWPNPSHSFRVPTVNPKDRAFVVFTSGSTGIPKGIVQPHKAYCTSIKAVLPTFTARGPRRHLAYASHTFDNSISDMFVPLSSGGCICIPSDDERLDNLEQAIRRMNVHQAELTPTVATLLKLEEMGTQFDTLALTGEMATASAIQNWAPRVRLQNIYGPAEITIFTTVNDHLHSDTDPLDVGKPVGGYAWIVSTTDPSRLVPVGCAGELVLGGPYVSDGYLTLDDQSNRPFNLQPRWASDVSANPKRVERFYRTGDIARFAVSGAIRLAGRQDTQIKVHGQRIELADIEYHLNASPSVQHGVVFYPATGIFQKSLVAVLTLRSTDNVSRGSAHFSMINPGDEKERARVRGILMALQDALRDKVPRYMLPSSWVVVDNIPLMPSGKLDRKRLKAWMDILTDREKEMAMLLTSNGPEASSIPGTVNERIVLEATAHVLSLNANQINLAESFIRLGGDSISAMALRTRCLLAGITFSVRDVLRAASLDKLATLAQATRKAHASSETTTEHINRPFVLAPIQRLFFAISPQGHNGYTQSILLHAPECPSHLQVRMAMDMLVERHSMLRARFVQSDNGEWNQLIKPYSSKCYGFSHSVIRNADEVAPHLELLRGSLDLTKGPVFHAALIACKGENGILLFLTAHHFVVDLVSFRVLLGELEEILRSETTKPDDADLGKACQTAFMTRPPSFQSWSESQKIDSTMDPEERIGDHDQWGGFWALDPDSVNFGSSVRHSFELNPTISSLLLGPSNEAIMSRPDDIIVGALLYSFQRAFPERRRPTFFRESHGRDSDDDSSDWSKTVGWFTTMAPLQLDSTDLNIIDTIIRTKDLRENRPDSGRQWFANHALSDPLKLAGSIEVIFNYFGRYHQLEQSSSIFKPCDALGSQPSEEGHHDMKRPAPLELAVTVQSGKVRAELTYDRRMNHISRLKTWMDTSKDLVEGAVKQLATMDRRLTLRDLPHFRGSYVELDHLTNQVLPRVGLSMLDIEDVLPLGPMQSGIAFSMLCNPKAYAISWHFEIGASPDHHPLTARRLAEAWEAVVERHAALRTIIAEDFDGTGSPGQLVLRNLKPKIVLKTKESREQSIPIMPRETAPYPKAKDLLLPHKLTIAENGSSAMLQCRLDISHTVIDGASLSVLIEEMAMLLNASRLLVAPVPYASYVSFVRQQNATQSKHFWKGFTQDMEPCILPVMPPQHSLSPVRLGSVTQHITSLDAIRNICRTRGFTTLTVIHAAWSLVLQAYTGATNSCFGYLTSGRNLSVDGVERIIGPVANVLICKADLDAKTTTSVELMRSVQSDMFDCGDHQTLSLSEIQQFASIDPGKRLFNTMVTQEVMVDAHDLEKHFGLRFKSGELHDPTEYDMGLHVREEDGKLSIEFNFWSDSFDESHVTAIALTLDRIITGLVTGPDSKVAQLQLCSISDLQHIRTWHESQIAVEDKCVHHLIADIIHAQPESEAVCAWDGRLTFRELDEWSSRLACHILNIAPSCGPERFVALCLRKGKWLPVAMLAAMKTGAAFVSLEPTFPVDRLKDIAQDINAPVVICSPEHSDLPETIGSLGKKVVLDQNLITCLAQDAPDVKMKDVRPEHPVYAVFTSGSTGKPKGVIMEHRAYAANILAQKTVFRMGRKTRALQFASYAFDVYLFETVNILATGGCICIPTDDDKLSDLAEVVRLYKINWAALTPTVANLHSPDVLRTLEVLACGGEQLSKSVIQKWASRVYLVNGYGPSECCIANIYNTTMCSSTEPTDIGFASGCYAWIVRPSDHNTLVPVGGVGELLLEGPSMARGYLNQPTKTANAFITNPAWATQDMGHYSTDCKARRFYKTGDLVRYTRSGRIIFLGRKDTQIKINGQRLEVEEVEHHILQDINIAQAVVCFPQRGAFRKQLVAVVSMKQISTQVESDRVGSLEVMIPTLNALMIVKLVKQLEIDLSQKLPAYMVPRTIIAVRHIPMSASTKLDRKAVLECIHLFDTAISRKVAMIGADDRNDSQNYEGPIANQTASLMGELVAEVLAIPVINVHLSNSFLRCGGDSISALRLAALCRRRGIAASVRDLMSTKTLNELGIELALSKSQPPRSQTGGYDKSAYSSFPLSPIQQLYFELNGGEPVLQTQSSCLLTRQPLDAENLSRSIQKIVASHHMLRARYYRDSEHGWRQSVDAIHSANYHYSYHKVDTTQQARTIAEETRKSLNVESGPLFAAVYLAVKNQENLLFLVAHHLIVDLVSWRIIIEDLQQLLQNGGVGPDLLTSTSFRDWVIAQRQYVTGDLSAVQDVLLPFEINDTLASPLGKRFHLQQLVRASKDMITESFSVGRVQSATILGDELRAYGCEPLDFFVASIAQSFNEVFSAQLLLHLESHGREEFDDSIDLARTVGWFTAVYPLWVPCTGNFLRNVGLVSQIRRRVARSGWEYFSARQILNQNALDVRKVEPEVIVNYHGQSNDLEQQDAFFKSTTSLVETDDDAHAGQASFVTFEIAIKDGIIDIDMLWNRHISQPSLMKQWTSRIVTLLEGVSKVRRNLPAAIVDLRFPFSQSPPSELLHGLDADNVEDIIPCSPMQTELYNSQQKGKGFYHAIWYWEVKTVKETNTLSASALVEAWEQIVRLHPVLRTVFRKTRLDPKPHQIIMKDVKPATWFSRSSKSNKDTLQYLGSVSPYDYDVNEPWHRLLVVQSNSGALFLRLDMCHVLADGSAMENILHDWSILYTGERTVARRTTFREYVTSLTLNPRSASREYWRRYLCKDLDPFEIRSQLRPSISCNDAAFHTIPIPQSAVAASLMEVAVLYDSTPANLFRAAWTIILRALNPDAPNVSFGYLVYGRSTRSVPDAMSIVGPLFNTLPCIIACSAKQTLAQLVASLQADYLEGVNHQDYSVAETIASDQVEINGRRLRLAKRFDTLVNFRRGVKMEADSDDSGQENRGVIFDEIECVDPMDYTFVLEITQAATSLDANDCIAAALSFWERDVSREIATRIAESVGIVLQMFVEHARQKNYVVQDVVDLVETHLSS